MKIEQCRHGNPEVSTRILERLTWQLRGANMEIQEFRHQNWKKSICNLEEADNLYREESTWALKEVDMDIERSRHRNRKVSIREYGEVHMAIERSR